MIRSAAAQAVTVTKITQVEQHHNMPLAEAAPQRSYKEAVKEGKRPPANYGAAAMGSASLPPPVPDAKRRNTNLLSPHYDEERERQQAYHNDLQTPRSTYSPVTPYSVEEYPQPDTPAVAFIAEAINGGEAIQQNGSYSPAGHLARLASQNGTTMEEVQLHH